MVNTQQTPLWACNSVNCLMSSKPLCLYCMLTIFRNFYMHFIGPSQKYLSI